jgi:hypothetical protein
VAKLQIGMLRSIRLDHTNCLQVDIRGRGPPSSDRREGGPRPRCPGQTRELFRLRQPVDLVHALKTVEGLMLLVPPRTPRSSGHTVYAHVVYDVILSVICCYMLYVCDMLYACYMSSVRGGS